VKAMQIARTEYLVTDSLIPDATSKARLERRDILPPRMLSAPRSSPRRIKAANHPRRVRSFVLNGGNLARHSEQNCELLYY
jgi:hypothetical protein